MSYQGLLIHWLGSTSMGRISSEDACDLLRRAGLAAGAVLGSGMEGVVVSLDADHVAKVWFDRPEDEVSRLKVFYDAAGRSARLRLAEIERVVSVDGHTVSVERFVAGRRLSEQPSGGQRTVTRATIDGLGDALDALAGVPRDPALSSLSILPGESPFGPGAAFPESLAGLVRRRVPPVADALDAALGGTLASTLAQVQDELSELRPRREGLVHGDLIPDNVLLAGEGTPGVIDFGFLTTYGDPDFDVAVAPAIYDMYGPTAAENTRTLTEALAARFGTTKSTIATYRKAYALATAGCFGSGPEDGHFRWCARQLSELS